VSINQLFPELKSYKIKDFEKIKFERPVLLIAMTARTGSTHLCSALSSVIDVPAPVEIFNPRGIIQTQLRKRNVTNFKDYMVSLSQDSGECFIFNASWGDFSRFKGVCQTLFPDLNVLYLNRLDIEQHAVSLFKASLSGIWHKSNAKTNAENESNDDISNAFNLSEICKCIDTLDAEKNDWESFFSDVNIDPVRINYEDFESNVEDTVNFILKRFSIAKKNEFPVSNYKKLFDETSEQWVMRLKKHRGCI